MKTSRREMVVSITVLEKCANMAMPKYVPLFVCVPEIYVGGSEGEVDIGMKIEKRECFFPQSNFTLPLLKNHFYFF